MTATPLTANVQQKLSKSTLVMDTPFFVMLAGEWLRNRGDELHPDNVGFLATRVENDTKVF